MQVIQKKISLVDDLYIKNNVGQQEILTELDNLIWKKEGEENRQKNINKNEDWVNMKNEEARIKAQGKQNQKMHHYKNMIEIGSENFVVVPGILPDDP